MTSARLPAVLVIGAMRAGTTALYADLGAHSRLYGAPGKEPHLLVNDELDVEGCRRAYHELFKGARGGSCASRRRRGMPSGRCSRGWPSERAR